MKEQTNHWSIHSSSFVLEKPKTGNCFHSCLYRDFQRTAVSRRKSFISRDSVGVPKGIICIVSEQFFGTIILFGLALAYSE